MTSDQDLAGLPEDVRGALLECERALNFMFAGDSLDIIRAELLRLARENAEFRTALAQQNTRAATAEAELTAARETIKRLNRRVQVAEAGIAERVKASAPGSFGRGMANAAADMFMHERDEALAELAALKRKIAEAPTMRLTFGPTVLPALHDYDPNKLTAISNKRVALLPVGGDA